MTKEQYIAMKTRSIFEVLHMASYDTDVKNVLVSTLVTFYKEYKIKISEIEQALELLKLDQVIYDYTFTYNEDIILVKPSRALELIAIPVRELVQKEIVNG